VVKRAAAPVVSEGGGGVRRTRIVEVKSRVGSVAIEGIGTERQKVVELRVSSQTPARSRGVGVSAVEEEEAQGHVKTERDNEKSRREKDGASGRLTGDGNGGAPKLRWRRSKRRWRARWLVSGEGSKGNRGRRV
jgi:hypothetical protein